MNLTRAIAAAYAALLTVDGMLSVHDVLVPSGRPHLSTWTTVTLCIVSIPVFIVGIVLGFLAGQRPRWPLLLASGAYTLFLAVLFAVVIGTVVVGGFESLNGMGESVSDLAAVVFAVAEVVVGTVCLIGAIRRVQLVSTTA